MQERTEDGPFRQVATAAKNAVAGQADVETPLYQPREFRVANLEGVAARQNHLKWLKGPAAQRGFKGVDAHITIVAPHPTGEAIR